MADFTTRKLVESIDWKATLTNVHTTGFWSRAFLSSSWQRPGCHPMGPRHAQTASGCPLTGARIRNTLHLEELWLMRPPLVAKDCEKDRAAQP